LCGVDLLADEINQWLAALGLEKYAGTFFENEIDMEAARYLSDGDLKELGLPMGPRRKIAAAIDVMQSAESPQSEDTLSQPSVRGERRQVTVLFADIAGFTSLSSRMDAEETHALLNRFFAVVDDVVGTYGGSIDKHIGDAVMAVFGAPLAHTDDPDRALAAALDIHDKIAQLDPPLTVHIGVASGQVVASYTGSAAHAEYTVTGDSVNLAARLTDIAKAGETLASASVQRALGDRFMGINLGEQTIEGLLEPVAVWRLDEIGSGKPESGQAIVGRARELRQFSAALEHCLETGGGETIIVRGEAGIGKTRLVEEFARLAVARGFAVHAGLVLDFGTAKGQDAVRALLRSLLDIPPGSTKAVRLQAAQRAVDNGLLPVAQRVHLNDLLDLPQPPDLNGIYEAMDNDTRNRGKLDTVSDVVRSLSRSSPLFLQLEDTHWADPAILSHMAHLARMISDIPALLVLTTRITGDRLDQAWRGSIQGAPLTTIDLGALRASEANELAQKFETLDGEVITACVERCGGNPLFLEQLLRNADDLSAGDIPGTIQGIVQARLDALPAGDRTAIQAASVLGQRFTRPELAALLDDKNYDPAKLIENVLIRPAGNDYHFAHALIREGVYASMLRPRRTELHRLAAKWFRDSDPILHAEHLDKAEEPGAAQAYLDAATNEVRSHRYERAQRLIERALPLGQTPEIQFEMNCFHGDILRDLGQTDQSIAAFEQAIDSAVGDAQICRANIGMAEGLRIKSRHNDGLECLAAAESSAKKLGSAKILSLVHGLKGSLYFQLSKVDECVVEHEKALHYGRETGSAEVQARAYSGVADAQYLRGQMLSANKMFGRCVALAKENNLARIAAANLTMIGVTKFYSLEFGSGQVAFDEALVTSSTIGDNRAMVVVKAAMSYGYVEQGLFNESLETTRAAENLARKIGLGAFGAVSVRHQSATLLEMGQPDKAIRLAEQAWKMIIDHNFEKFAGPFCLSVIARSSPETDRQNWAIREGFRILSDGAVSHNHLHFYREIMEAGMERGDWALMHRARDALRNYTQAEPLPWSDLYIARAGALHDFHHGNDRDTAIDTLRELKGRIERSGAKLALPRVENALAEIDR
jgi:class 3 adenylate cyclase/tetratricopeptide (TPR) repeat protein